MNGHLEVCGEFVIPCPNKCSEEFRVKRKDKSIHLIQECPLQETECPYSQCGCEVKVKRRNLEQHEKEEMHKHMKLTIIPMQSDIITLQGENEVLRNNVSEFQSLLKEEKEATHALEFAMKTMQSKMVKLEKENEVFSNLMTRGSLEWKINEIQNNISENISAYSVPFYVGLYKFQGCVEWNETEYYLGIFLHIIKGEWDDKLKWPIKYRYSIALVNQLDAKNNYEMNDEITDETLEKFSVCFRKPITEGNDGFGPFDFFRMLIY